jgi:hypothetical protein
MRTLVIVLALLAAGLVAGIHFEPYPLILNEGDGEHLLRRYAAQTLAAAPGPIPEFIIKIDRQNGGAEDFVAVTETLNAGASFLSTCTTTLRRFSFWKRVELP